MDNKKTRFLKGFLVTALALLFMAGCRNIFEAPKWQKPSGEGVGTFTLSISKTARTIMPNISFSSYKLDFYNEDEGPDAPEDPGGTAHGLGAWNETIPGFTLTTLYAQYNTGWRNDPISIHDAGNVSARPLINTAPQGSFLRFKVQAQRKVNDNPNIITFWDDDSGYTHVLNKAPDLNKDDEFIFDISIDDLLNKLTGSSGLGYGYGWPADDYNYFTEIGLYISDGGGGDGDDDKTVLTETWPGGKTGGSVTLNQGTYDLFVTAYANGQEAARGILKGIKVAADKVVSGSVILAPVGVSGGTGTFSWNISYPADVVKAEMVITPLSGGTEKQTVTLGASPAGGTVTLNAGFYRVTLKLGNSKDRLAERWETLHVYMGMDSAFACAFTENQFTNNKPDLSLFDHYPLGDDPNYPNGIPPRVKHWPSSPLGWNFLFSGWYAGQKGFVRFYFDNTDSDFFGAADVIGYANGANIYYPRGAGDQFYSDVDILDLLGGANSLEMAHYLINGGVLVKADLFILKAGETDPDYRGTPRPQDGVELGGSGYLGGPRSSAIVPGNIFSQWEPGRPDGIPNSAGFNTFRTINAASYSQSFADQASRTQLTADINKAIQDAGDFAASSGNPQVVQLSAGIFYADGSITINRSNVVLRGMGASTILRGMIWNGAGGGYINVGSSDNYQFNDPNHTHVANVTGSLKSGDQQITVNNAYNFSAGDILMVDRIATAEVNGGDDRGASLAINGGEEFRKGNPYMMRTPGLNHASQGPASAAGEYRSVRQYVEVASVSGNTIYIKNKINIDFPAACKPQVWNVSMNCPPTKNSGLEDLKVEAITYTYNHTPCILLQFDSSYCWIKNVESDGRRFAEDGSGTGYRGVHIRVRGFRNNVNGCYVHDSSNNWPGGTGYGYEIQGTDCLLDNNIARELCKPFLGYVSGGGNVIAYNYVPECATYREGHQETAFDFNHAAYSHSDLYEGNYGANLSTDSTTGNSGQFVVFRNHAWGYNLVDQEFGNSTTGGSFCLFSMAYSNEVASIGNVWLIPEDVDGSSGRKLTNRWDFPLVQETRGFVVYNLGTMNNSSYTPPRDSTTYGWLDWYDNCDAYPMGWAMGHFHRHLDYDYSSRELYDNPANPVKNLPKSLFRDTAPDYFGGYTWPPVNPHGRNAAERVSGLPAKDRYLTKYK
jgi:hypothetical protein